MFLKIDIFNRSEFKCKNAMKIKDGMLLEKVGTLNQTTKDFDCINFIPKDSEFHLEKIFIIYGDFIFGIQFSFRITYPLNFSLSTPLFIDKHSLGNPSQDQICLEQNEHIIEISGNKVELGIKYLVFITTLGKKYCFGDPEKGDRFCVHSPKGFHITHLIGGLSGNSADYYN
jgi:hypothetical protein